MAVAISYRSVIDDIESDALLAEGDRNSWWYENLATNDEESAWQKRLMEWIRAVWNWDPDYESKAREFEATLP